MFLLSDDNNGDGEDNPKSIYSSVLEQMHELQQEPDSHRHYHPQILLLSGSPTVRPGLVDFAHSITRGKSLLICGYIIPVCSLVILFLQMFVFSKSPVPAATCSN